MITIIISPPRVSSGHQSKKMEVVEEVVEEK